jgi:hypothetical protein
MQSLFDNLNVVEILRIGLSGLLFLLSLLAYRLIDGEQRRAGTPRKGILRTIYIFMGVNLFGAALAATAGYFGSRHEPEPDANVLNAETYLVDYTSYLVDLTQWTEATLGPVIVTRTDFVRKVSKTTADYIIPYFTTGKSIECKPIIFSSRPYFVGPKNDPERKGMHYDYVLPIGHEPAGHSEMVSSQFTFPSGFANPQTEWWESRVEYPSKAVSVVFLFPANKPAKDVFVTGKLGDESAQPINDNLATLLNGGRIVQWVGINEKGKSRVHFQWNW